MFKLRKKNFKKKKKKIFIDPLSSPDYCPKYINIYVRLRPTSISSNQLIILIIRGDILKQKCSLTFFPPPVYPVFFFLM